MTDRPCVMDDMDALVSAMDAWTQRTETTRATLVRILDNIRLHVNEMAREERDTAAEATVRRRAVRGTSVTADPASVFLARVRNGDTTAIAIQQILDRVGLKVADGTDHKADGTIRSLTTVEAIYVRDANLVERTLRVIVDAWRGNILSLRADFVGGVAAFLADAGDIDDAELSRRAGAYSPTEILEATTGDRRRKLAAYLADVYTR